jgi:hypothetical protein
MMRKMPALPAAAERGSALAGTDVNVAGASAVVAASATAALSPLIAPPPAWNPPNAILELTFTAGGYLADSS